MAYNKQIFFDDWEETKLERLKKDFGITDKELEGVEILHAYYTHEYYQGDAWVLFRKDGKLYEVNGGHCSCYGLSEQGYSGDTTTQWQPEEVTKEELIKRNKWSDNYGL